MSRNDPGCISSAFSFFFRWGDVWEGGGGLPCSTFLTLVSSFPRCA